jgi:hypothetical protein
VSRDKGAPYPMQATVKSTSFTRNYGQDYELHVKRGSHTTVVCELTLADLYELRNSVTDALDTINGGGTL